jgi:hypothetical protein
LKQARLTKAKIMVHSSKTFLVLLITASLVAVVGNTPLLLASSSPSHSTHFDSVKGPGFPLNGSGCYECHADGILQCDAGGPVFWDNKLLEDTLVCDNCHSEGGIVDGVAMAKANWVSGVYESNGDALKAGKEQWCVSCHDGGVSVCYGVSAPNVDLYYTSGHGRNEAVKCLDCHDASMTHIDHEQRTYDLDESTGQVINAYGNSYRLKKINGRPPMTVPTEQHNHPLEHLEDFNLCLDCHDLYEVIGEDENDVTHTNFWNDESIDQGRTYGDGTIRNSHYYHLSLPFSYDSDWDGSRSNDSFPNCATCHNVHGAPNGAMIRHGELMSVPGTTDKVPAFNFKYLDANYLPNPDTTLTDSTGGTTSYPNNSCFACHGAISYYRNPNLSPKIINQKADPEAIVVQGQPEGVLFTCFILDHDDNIDSVAINLSAIDGIADQAMYDDGTNGDVTAGDNIYSFQAVIPVTTGSAEKSLQITATDLDGHSDQRDIVLPVLVLDGNTIVWDADVTHETTFYKDLNITGSLILSDGDTIRTYGNLTVGSSLSVQSGGTLILLGDTYEANQAAGGTPENPYGRGPTITATDITIAAGASINADGTGFGPAEGPGAGYTVSTRCSGGGFGGLGGDSSTGAVGGSTYGSASAPTALGSGGGYYSTWKGSGGGAIKLVATGTITVDGILSANGDDVGGSSSGGGSGGSIWIASGTLTGSGTISSTGGTGSITNGGGGGGGRIDVSDTTYDFSGTITSVGGIAHEDGQLGTILFPSGFWSNVTLTHNIALSQDVNVAGSLTIADGGSLITSGDVTVATLTVEEGGALVLVGDVNDVNASAGGTAESPYGSGPIITATDITIAAGGSINADGMGFNHANGPGAGYTVSTRGSGGGFGGVGGDSSTGAVGGSTYGSASAPTALGSGGGYYSTWKGSGGGAMKLVATGTITVDGILSANGDDVGGGNSSGGSGGSIWIASGTLTGSGTVSATGGTGSITNGGGGGGGRIDVSDTTYDFSGTITSAGGTAYFDGQAGTIVFPAGFWTNLTLTQDIALSNDLNVSGSLTISDGVTLTVDSDLSVEATLTVQSGGTLIVDGDLIVGTTLTVANGGTLVLVGDPHAINGGTAENPYGSGRTVTATDITIALGGSINADGTGFRYASGPGAGYTASYRCSGGGFGGVGGDSSTGAVGGSTYGSASAPTALGSGGGYYSTWKGSGGGAIKLVAAGTITVDGTLSANGDNVGGDNSAGGSGGSIWIASGVLAGSGTISAIGGNAHTSYPGGGGGGRIDVSDTTNGFAGIMSVNGGAGFMDGEDGTIVE